MLQACLVDAEWLASQNVNSQVRTPSLKDDDRRKASGDLSQTNIVDNDDKDSNGTDQSIQNPADSVPPLSKVMLGQSKTIPAHANQICPGQMGQNTRTVPCWLGSF